jgi:hypothetical protein
MAKSSEGQTGRLSKLRERLSGRRERRAKKAHAEAEIKRGWEKSGDVGRRGAHGLPPTVRPASGPVLLCATSSIGGAARPWEG